MIPKNIRILVVDDMPTIRDLIKEELRKAGYDNVLVVPDGERALETLMQSQLSLRPIRMIISDWKMPKMTGIDLLKKVRAIPEMVNLPFVLITSETERECVAEAAICGVSQYIVKPFSPKQLMDRLESAWRRHHDKG